MIAQVVYEQKTLLRNPMSLASAVALPLLFLVVLGALDPHRSMSVGGVHGLEQYYLPGILTFSLASTAFANVAITTAYRRDFGLLKHLRSTPLSTAKLLLGICLSVWLTVIGVTALALGIARVGYGISVTGNIGSLLLLVTAAVLAFTSLGFAMSAVRAQSAVAAVNLVLLPLLLASGLFVPLPPHSILQHVADLLPFAPFGEGLRNAVFPLAGPGSGLGWGHIGVLLGWGLGGLVLAARTFRWQPRS